MDWNLVSIFQIISSLGIVYCVIMNTVIFRKQRELKKIQDETVKTQSTLITDVRTTLDALRPKLLLEDIQAMTEYQNGLRGELQKTKDLLNEKELDRIKLKDQIDKLNEQLKLTDEAFNRYFGLLPNDRVSTLHKLQDALAS